MVKGTMQSALEDGEAGKAEEVLDSFISKLESLKTQIKDKGNNATANDVV